MRKTFSLWIALGLVMAIILAGCGNSGFASAKGGYYSEESSAQSTAEPVSLGVESTVSEEKVSEPAESEKESETVSSAAEAASADQETVPSEDETTYSMNSEVEENAAGTGDGDGVTPSFKEYMDSYEEFMNEYCDFMEKYNENPTDTELLLQYMDYMDKYTEFMKQVNEYSEEENEMSTADLNYYLDVMNRVEKRLLEVSVSASDQQ